MLMTTMATTTTTTTSTTINQLQQHSSGFCWCNSSLPLLLLSTAFASNNVVYFRWLWVKLYIFIIVVNLLIHTYRRAYNYTGNLVNVMYNISLSVIACIFSGFSLLLYLFMFFCFISILAVLGCCDCGLLLSCLTAIRHLNGALILFMFFAADNWFWGGNRGTRAKIFWKDEIFFDLLETRLM